MTDSPEPEKPVVPRKPQQHCQRCGGGLVLAETLPGALGSPTYEIYRCRECSAFDWVVQDGR